MDHRKAHILGEKERTDDIKIEENVKFSQMYLSDSVLSGLHAAGFIWPSPIQLSAIPLGRCGLDLVVQAKSGTGKTCVFAVVALEMISIAAKTTQVLIVAPTREIAVQITQVIDTIGSHMAGLRAHPFIGGFSVMNDKSKLSCCHIAIGTPGRLNQLIELGFLKVDNVRLFVMDEADELLQNQFKTSILKMASHLPLNKQVMALSATYPEEISSTLDKVMRSPSYVRLDRENPSLIGVNQFVRLVPYHPQPHHRYKSKQNELVNILSYVAFNQCLIFSNSQMRAESLCTYLKESNWPVAYLSGGQAQTDRLKAFEALCSYKIRVLVSTDVSARGIDSEHVNLVINLDIPWDQSTYLHRVGRAGRFGSYGTAISLACEGEEWDAMKAISSLANVKIKIIAENWTPNMTLSSKNKYDYVEQLSEEDLKTWLKYKTYHCDIKSGKTRAKTTEYSSGKSKHPPKLEARNETLSLEDYYKRELDLIPSKISGYSVLKAKNEKSSLELLKHSQFHSPIPFSYNDLLNQCEMEEESIVKPESSPALTLGNISKKIPSLSEIKDLEHFVDALLDGPVKSVKVKHELNSISLLEGVIQGRDFVKNESRKEKNDQQDLCDSTKDIKCTSLVNGIDCDLTKNLKLTEEISSKSATNVPSVVTKPKSHKDDYCGNTGFGRWTSVTKEEVQYRAKENSFNSQPESFYEDSVSTSSDEDTFKSSNDQSDPWYDPYYQSYYASACTYVHSAQKFASMMEYVRTLGQMSARAALEYQHRLDGNGASKSKPHKHNPTC